MKFVECSEDDDADIVSLLESTPLEGIMDVVYTSRPSFFEALRKIGKTYRVMGVRDEKGLLVALACIIIQDRYINGKEQEVGYLSHLRIARHKREKGLLRKGFKVVREIMDEMGLEYVLTAILADNKTALSILTSKKEGFPNYHYCGEIFTKILSTHAQQKKLDRYKEDEKTLSKGLPNLFPVGNLLNGAGKKVISSVEGAKCLLWDQSSFKQVIIKKYSRVFKWARPLMQRYYGISLPQEGGKFDFDYVVELQTSSNKEFAQLISKCLRTTEKKQVVIGLDSKHPLVNVVHQLKGYTYKSKLFAVSWNKKVPIVNTLRGEYFYPEVSIL